MKTAIAVLFSVACYPAFAAYMSHTIFASWNPYSTDGGQVRYSTVVVTQCNGSHTSYKLNHRGDVLFTVWQPRVESGQQTFNKPSNCPGSENWGFVHTITANSVPCGCFNNRNINISDTGFYVGNNMVQNEEHSYEKFITRECEYGGGGS